MAIRTRALLTTGLLLAAQAVSPVMCTARSAPVAASFPYCSWWVETTATSLNIAFPDADAAYWTTPFLATSDLVSLTVNGQYADARYTSLNAYNNAGAAYTCGSTNTASALADYLIAPDPGSQNPFQVNALLGGRYTVTLVPSGASTPAQNTIPFYGPGCQPAPSQSGALPSTLGFLILRVYLPHDGFDKVALPDLTLRYADGHSVALPQCRRTAPSAAQATAAAGTSPTTTTTTEIAVEEAPDWIYVLRQLLAAGDLIGAGAGGEVLPPPCTGSTCPPELTFFRAPESATSGLFPNADNKYVSALVQPKPEAVVVIRAKAATFPPGMQALPWNPQTTNLRYWSMCSNVYRRPYPVVVDNVGGQTILGCVPDLATAQDGSGFYTYVVSQVRDRPSDTALAANSATWLPFSDTQPYARHLMILRNMLGTDFPYSVQNCAAGSDPTSIAACAASMGAYYPQTAECRARTFESGGTAACFQEYQLAQTNAANHRRWPLGAADR